MSKKSSTFALEMEMIKKIYITPQMEVTDIKGLNPLAMGDPSEKPHTAPPVNAPVF